MRSRFRRSGKRSYLAGARKSEINWTALEGLAMFQAYELDNGRTIADAPNRVAFWNQNTATQVVAAAGVGINNDNRLRRLVGQIYAKAWSGTMFQGATLVTAPTSGTPEGPINVWDQLYQGGSGGTAQGNLLSSSAWGGIPVWWAWIYETFEESQVPLGFRFNNAAYYVKNRRVFRQGMFVPSMQRPHLFNFDLKFPRGLATDSGERETYQVSLIMNCDLPATGIGAADAVALKGWGKAQYTHG